MSRPIHTILAPVFGGVVVAFVVLSMGGPIWAVMGLGATVMMLAALSEDHHHD